MEETTRAPTEILDALIAAYNRGDPVCAASLYAAAGTHEDVAYGKLAQGPNAVQRGLATFLETFPDAHWDVQHVLGGESACGAVYEMSGTLHRDLGPFRARGQQLRFQGVLVVIVDQGCISSSRDFWDSATVTRQLQAA